MWAKRELISRLRMLLCHLVTHTVNSSVKWRSHISFSACQLFSSQLDESGTDPNPGVVIRTSRPLALQSIRTIKAFTRERRGAEDSSVGSWDVTHKQTTKSWKPDTGIKCYNDIINANRDSRSDSPSPFQFLKKSHCNPGLKNSASFHMARKQKIQKDLIFYSNIYSVISVKAHFTPACTQIQSSLVTFLLHIKSKHHWWLMYETSIRTRAFGKSLFY